MLGSERGVDYTVVPDVPERQISIPRSKLWSATIGPGRFGPANVQFRPGIHSWRQCPARSTNPVRVRSITLVRAQPDSKALKYARYLYGVAQ